MTVMLWLCLGGVDLGRAYGYHIGLTDAARTGARYAALLPNATEATIKDQVRAGQPSLGITDPMINVDRSQADRRSVSVTYPFTPFTPFVAALGDGATLPLRTGVTMPVMGP